MRFSRCFVLACFLITCLNSLLCSAVPVSVSFNQNGQSQQHFSDGNVTPYLFSVNSDKSVSMATLNWPPYISELQCNRGWVFQLGVALMLSQGYSVTVHFLPWARAVKEVESGNIDILFPEYYIEPEAPSDIYKGKKRLDFLSLSRAFPGGEIAFMKRRDSKVSFNGNLKALVGERIGVVRGYQNTPEFDRMMDAGQFNILPAVNDLQLAKLLYARRVNLILADPKVLFYTVRHSNESNKKINQMLNNMEPVTPTLDYKYLYFALSKGKSSWQQTMKDINEALVNFDHTGELQNIINTKSQVCK